MEKAIKLPLNCSAEYIKGFLSEEESTRLYRQLTDEYGIEELRTKITIDDKATFTDTGKIMFLDEYLYIEHKFPEDHWGKTAIWPKELMEIKKRVENFAGIDFNVCVCIYYPDGTAGVAYHSDYVAFGDTTVVPSISIGEEREFYLREKETFEVYEVILAEGSILIMGENCQERYEHSLPFNPKYKKGRINLTFRQYGFRD